MEMKQLLKQLREARNLTQTELAQRVLVTRQAVSRWETGETQPNTDTLKMLSNEFKVSNFILICTYREGGANPELLLYKKR